MQETPLSSNGCDGWPSCHVTTLQDRNCCFLRGASMSRSAAAAGSPPKHIPVALAPAALPSQ